ncbi:LysE family translocator [Porticoccaceae bacterium]|nr:LysE family translocator [Porticoccaceae bacterium]MDA8788624.1 LysE family translocator [Porticoccaceae bacterium]MDB2633901.1 LysE family translocator [Porticoccaceae bacterium]MDB2664482.1 LysE family translocator [Porticoccaceae bacterium]
MIITELSLGIVIFALSASITPGPNNIMIMASGLNFGIRRSIPHALGIAIGFPIMLLALGSGLGTIFDRYPLFHEIIKVSGLLYLVYLAGRIAKAAPIEHTETSTKPLNFFQAALFQWVNPKAWVMGTGAISSFTVSNQSMFDQVAFIALTFLVAAAISVSLWLVVGHQLKLWLKNNRYQRWFNFTMAGLLIMSILPVISSMLIGL